MEALAGIGVAKLSVDSDVEVCAVRLTEPNIVLVSVYTAKYDKSKFCKYFG